MAEPGVKAGALTEAISAFEQQFTVESADTPEIAQQAYRVRHQVYCIECGYEEGRGGIEIDEFDAHARHVILQDSSTGQVVGTVRLVLPSPESPERSFPMQRVCQPSLLGDLPLATTAEVSRYAISKQWRAVSGASNPLMRLALVRGILQLSNELRITHWCAVMERPLLRLLQSSAIHFQQLGPLVAYHGLRQPAFGRIDSILARVNREQPGIWNFITDGGKLWRPKKILLAA